MKITKFRVKGVSDIATVKDDIQRVLRSIVIARDDGCIFRNVRNCGGEIGKAVLQADHLITRGNNATYADHRLVVCVCRSCHFWKKYNKERYDELVKTLIPKESVELWKRCDQDRFTPHRKGAYDFQLELVALKQHLSKIE